MKTALVSRFRLAVTLCLLAFSTPALAVNPGDIVTVAGTGSAGFSGDNVAATSADLYQPTGAAFDSAGNLYIADSYNYRVRKVDVTTSIITTVAGNGTGIFTGGNVSATSTGVCPQSLALDGANNLYIVDICSQRIRKVDSTTGTITTVAGNGSTGFSGDNVPATSASLNSPHGVAVDNAGNIFIADTFNHRIRKVNAATGIITTVAGSGTAGYSGDNSPAISANLKYPRSIAFDNSGNLVIADMDNHSIRRVDAVSGIITTIAGTGTWGFSGDGAAATSANLYTPCGIAIDSSGDIYIAEMYNQRIRKVSAADGIITTVAGNGTWGFSGDYGPATSASLYNPFAVAVDGSGNIVVADYYNNRIRKVYVKSIPTTNPGSPEPIHSSANDQYDPFVSDLGEVVWVESTGGYSQVFSSTRGQLTNDSTYHMNSSVNSLGDVIWSESFWNGFQNVYSIKGIIAGQPTTLFSTSSSGYLQLGNINDRGEFVYSQTTGSYTQVFSSTRGRLTFDSTNHDSPAIANNGDVAWLQHDGSGFRQVYRLTSGAPAPAAVTNTPYDKNDLAISDSETVWNQTGGPGTDLRLFSSTRGQLTFAFPAGNHSLPGINSCGDVVFNAMGTPPAQVYRLGNSAPCIVAPEPNNAPNQALTTSLGSTVKGVIDNGSNPEDWYRFEAASGGSIHILANDDKTPPIITMGLYDGSMNLLASPSITNNVISITHTAAYTGTYYLRMATSGGRAGYAFTIKEAVPSPASPLAVTGAASSISATEAVLNATVNANGDTTSVAFEIGLDSNYSNTFAATQSPLAAAAGDSPVSVAVSGLFCNSTYHYRVVASNTFGTTKGLDATFATSPCPAFPPTVSTGSATDVSTTSITLNGWAGANGDVTDISFEYGPTSNYGATVTAIQSPLAMDTFGPVSAPVSGLTCGTTYHYRASGRNGAGTTNGLDATFTSTACPPPGSITISTVAGNGSSTLAGDGGPATSASLSTPYGVTVDSFGNLYIADMYNHRIRKVAAGTGIISTVAGGGAGGLGDDGPATAARLSNPQGVAIDSSGNLFIADQYNHRIRKVAAGTGIITTVAGNGTGTFAGDGSAATDASLWYPSGVALDSYGNLFIVDSYNKRIRKVAVDTGIITTVAGNGTATFAGDGGPATSASLYSPRGVSIDSADNLFIADRDNSRIRKVTAGTGIITTVAGNGAFTFAGDGGPATAASLSAPTGVIVDSYGNLFIADQSNSRIRKVDAGTGIISTVAGNGGVGFAGDGGVATSATLDYPSGVTIDSSGNLYIADFSNRIRKVIKAGPTSAVIGYSPAGPYKTGDQVTITATFNDLVVDAPAPKIALSGANTLAATTMTKVDYSHYTYTHTIAAGSGSVLVTIPTGTDINGIPVLSAPGSGANFNVNMTATAPWLSVPASTDSLGKIYLIAGVSPAPGAVYTFEYRAGLAGTWTQGYSGILRNPTITLPYGQTYYFRVKVNAPGYLESGYTVGNQPCTVSGVAVAPAYLNIQSSTGGSVYLIAAPSPTPGANYVFQYKKTTDSTWTTLDSGTVRNPTISGLTPGTWQFQVYATATGYDQSTVTTGTQTLFLGGQAAAPANLNVQSFNAQAVSVYLIAAQSATPGALYNFEYSKDGAGWTAIGSPSATRNPTFILPAGPGTYQFRVYVTADGYTASAPRATGGSVTVTAPATAPAYLNVQSFNAITGATYLISAPSPTPGALYSFQYRLVGSPTWTDFSVATPVRNPTITVGSGNWEFQVIITAPNGYTASVPKAAATTVTR